ncbi:PEP-CTERM sorting domain-containing protein [Myxococcota bacterium]|nr:PEP-CTERM sorting domain-containing protein [Myxococcota bacterium]
MAGLWRSLIGLMAVSLLQSTGVSASLIDFNAFEHGRVVDLNIPGLSITAENVGGGPDLAVVFDSNLSGTRDPDLEAASGGATLWSAGNLVGVDLGGILILQENGFGCWDGVCNRPDDEGSRPAGSLTLDFEAPIESFGLDLIDIDGLTLELGALVFVGSLGTDTVPFTDLLNPGDVGNNSANRVDPLALTDMGIGNIQRIRVEWGGSGALDNLQYTLTPEPSTGSLIALGLVTLGVATGRRRPESRYWNRCETPTAGPRA